MKHTIFFLLAFVVCIFVGCKNCDCEPDIPETQQSTENQPDEPDRFSLVGKTYLYETTWEGSPAEDNYWAFT